MSNPTEILITLLFVIFTNIPQVFGVVMMAPQNTQINPNVSKEQQYYDETLLPYPYNISSPITNVLKYKFFDVNSTTEWINAWKYENENVTVFATQGWDLSMGNRFVIEEDIQDTGITLYAVFDGYGGNFTVDYLAYKMLDKLRTKIADIKKGNLDENLREYAYDNGTINYHRLLYDEIVLTDRNLDKPRRVKEILGQPFEYNESGSTVLIAIIEGNRLILANTGNSRAVMCDTEGQAYSLNQAHTFFRNAKETQRASKSSRKFPEWCAQYALSRVVGDSAYKRTVPMAIPDPEIFIYDLSKLNPKFIVVFTNSIWYGMSNAEEELKVTKSVWYDTSHIKEEQRNQKIITHLRENYDSNLLQAMINSSILYHRQGTDGCSRTIMVLKMPRFITETGKPTESNVL